MKPGINVGTERQKNGQDDRSQEERIDGNLSFRADH